MTNIKFKNIVKAPSDDELRQMENYYGVVFPDDYIKFLKLNNGGTPSEVYKFHANREYVLERFLAVIDNPKNKGKNGDCF